MTRFSAFACAAALAISAAPAATAATVLHAGWTDACGKGSNCFDQNGSFQKTFSASDFSGPVTVGQLLFDRAILGDLDGKTFRLSFALNGEELGTWGKFTMAGIGGDQLGVDGADFVWNPEDGDLILILEILPPPKAGLGSFLAALPENPAGLEEQDPPPLPGGNTPPGRTDEPVSAVPEPGAWAMMILGFGGAGALIRRRRAIRALA